jgi:hypothetical protein
MPPDPTTTGTDTQIDDLTAFRSTIGPFRQRLDPQPTAESLFSPLVCSVRVLKEHLYAYIFSGDVRVYDEDAVIAIEAAERLLTQAGRVRGQPEKPQAPSTSSLS